MGISKNKLLIWLLFAYLAVFPLGQLVRIGGFLLIDIILLGFLTIFLKGNFKKPRISKYFFVFVFIALFGFIMSSLVFRIGNFSGIFYLIRLVSNFGLFVSVYYLIKQGVVKRKFILKCLLSTVVMIGILGWVQYFLYPDLRALYFWGWDDHLNRLTSTLLDPGFTGIILVFGILGSIAYFLERNSKRILTITVFLFITLLFTYSRASYLALVIGSFYLLYKNNIKYFVLILAFLGVGIFLLPKSQGEGVRLERTASIDKRIGNYLLTLGIFKKSPLIGVGYDNLCLFKKDLGSHSCSGSDSSILFILATTGLLGLIIFINLLRHMTRVKDNIYGRVFLSSGLALLVHSQFTHSLFYPWVIGSMFILFATCVKE